MSGDIRIGVDIALTENAVKTISTLTKLSRIVGNLRRTTISAGQGMGQLSDATIALGDNIVNVGQELVGFADRMGIGEKEMKQFTTAAKSVRKALFLENTMLMVNKANLEEFGKVVGQFAMNPIITNLNQTTQAMTTMRSQGQHASDVLQQLYRGFSRAGPAIPLPILKELSRTYGENSTELLIFASRLQQATMSGTATGDMLKRLREEGGESLITWVTANNKLKENLNDIARIQNLTIASMGKTGMAVSQLSRDFFWVGLGSMFAVMSLSRLGSVALAAEQSVLGLQRATIRYSDSQEDMNKMQQSGITSGRQYRDAVIGLQEAELSLSIATKRVTVSREQATFAYLQFAFGTVPTVIRAVASLYPSLTALAFTQITEAQATAIANQQLGVMGILAQKTTFDIWGLTISVRAFTLAVGGFALGIPVVLALFAGMSAANKARSDIDELNKSMSELGITLREPGSPPLWNIFDVFGDSIGYASKEARRMSSSLAGALEPSLGGLHATSAHNYISVSVSGPFVIRSRSDIDAIGNGIMRKLRNRGVSG